MFIEKIRYSKDHKTLKTGVMAAENSALPKINVTFLNILK